MEGLFLEQMAENRKGKMCQPENRPKQTRTVGGLRAPCVIPSKLGMPPHERPKKPPSARAKVWDTFAKYQLFSKKRLERNIRPHNMAKNKARMADTICEADPNPPQSHTSEDCETAATILL